MENNVNKRTARLYFQEQSAPKDEECTVRTPVKEIITDRNESAEEILTDWIYESGIIENMIDFSLFSLSDIDRHYNGHDIRWCVDIYEHDGSGPVESISIPESTFMKEMFRILENYSENGPSD